MIFFPQQIKLMGKHHILVWVCKFGQGLLLASVNNLHICILRQGDFSIFASVPNKYFPILYQTPRNQRDVLQLAICVILQQRQNAARILL